MTPLVLLMSLLGLAFVGSYFVEGRALEGVGLPSGVEWVLLGVLLGPAALGIVRPAALEELSPLVHVAIGWLGFGIGLDFAHANGRRATGVEFCVGLASSLVPFALASIATWLVVRRYAEISREDSLVIALGVGALSSETTRHAVRWARARYGADGPLSDFLASISDVEDIVPIVALAFLASGVRELDHGAIRFDTGGLTLLAGALLGGIGAALLGDELDAREAWSTLLGLGLLGTGIAIRLGVAAVALGFASGLVLAFASPLRDSLRALVAPSERPVLLPAFVLAGASLRFACPPWVYAVAALAVAARFVGKLLVGSVLWRFAPVARPAGAALGTGLLSAGVLTTSTALTLALRHPGVLGNAALLVAFSQLVVGELVGPVAVRALLARTGEIPPSRESAASVDPTGGDTSS